MTSTGTRRTARSLTVASRSSLVMILLLAVLWTVGAGCSQYINPNMPDRIRRFTEPETGGQWLLYRPSSYDRRRAWPLIVLCHSSRPDSPQRQIRDWTELAEDFGFLVVAPFLKGTKSILPPGPEKQIPLQREDEKHILATIRQVRAGHNISEQRIFLHGFAGGAYTALPVGLRHPEVFRAISLAQPKFNNELLTDVTDTFDRFQPIYATYSVSDLLTGKHARRLVEWLRSRGANLQDDASSRNRRVDCRRAVEFFYRVIRTEPLIQIHTFPENRDNLLETRFKLRCSFEPTRYHWELGDGDESADAEPVHIYRRPGTYRVTLTLYGPKGRPHRRAVTLTVPGGHRRPASPASPHVP